MSHSERALRNRRERFRATQREGNIGQNSGRSHLTQSARLGDEKDIGRFFERLLSAGRLLRRRFGWLKKLEVKK